MENVKGGVVRLKRILCALVGVLLLLSLAPLFAIAERNIARGPFFGGERIHVVDLKIYMAVRWFNGGKVDHIPATIFDDCPKLTAVHDAVRDHAGVQAWYAKSRRP